MSEEKERTDNGAKHHLKVGIAMDTLVWNFTKHDLEEESGGGESIVTVAVQSWLIVCRAIHGEIILK